MSTPLIPERFGCGLKLPLEEILDIRARIPSLSAREPNFALQTVAAGVIASSIDKVFWIPVEAEAFCRIALLHVMADVQCAGALPNVVDVCFEFGPDLEAEARSALSQALFAAAHSLSLTVGKCHSTYGPSTALTIAVRGPAPNSCPEIPAEGVILLSRRLGALNELYLATIGFSPNFAEVALEQMAASQSELIAVAKRAGAWITDVSGFGLAGAVVEAAEATEREIELVLSDQHWIRGTSRSPDLPCLQAAFAPPAHWQLETYQKNAIMMRELSGPFLFFCERDVAETIRTQSSAGGAIGPFLVGQFNSSNRGVDIKWR